MRNRFTFLFSVLILLTTIEAHAQVQVGQTILGDTLNGGEGMGWDVSLSDDGNRLAVLGRRYTETPLPFPFDFKSAGRVQIFDWDATSMQWVQKGSDIIAKTDANTMPNETLEAFGTVRLSGNGERVAIGGGNSSGPNESEGLIKVFEWDAMTSDWVQIGSDLRGEDGEMIGFSLDLSTDGNRMIYGAPYRATTDGMGNLQELPGHVIAFDWNSMNQSWEQVGDTIKGFANGDQFSESVAISGNGNRIIVGADPWQIPTVAGFAQVYEYNSGMNTWDLVGPNNLVPMDTTMGFIVDISTDGNRIAITSDALSEDISLTRIYEYNNGNWTQLGADLIGPPATGLSIWGISLALSGDGNRIALTGGADPDYLFRAIATYEWSTSTSSWDMVGMPITNPADSSLGFGDVIAISSDGSRIAMGNQEFEDMDESEIGYVAVYGLASTSSIDPIRLEAGTLYPNPTSGKLTLKGLEADLVWVFDPMGRRVMTVENPGNQIDLSRLSPGVYALLFHLNDGTHRGARVIRK